MKCGGVKSGDGVRSGGGGGRRTGLGSCHGYHSSWRVSLPRARQYWPHLWPVPLPPPWRCPSPLHSWQGQERRHLVTTGLNLSWFLSSSSSSSSTHSSSTTIASPLSLSFFLPLSLNSLQLCLKEHQSGRHSLNCRSQLLDTLTHLCQ